MANDSKKVIHVKVEWTNEVSVEDSRYFQFFTSKGPRRTAHSFYQDAA